MNRLLSIIAAIFLAIAPAMASQLAAEADSAYNRQDYKRAIELYQQAANDDGTSAVLYYNLGNAYYRTAQLGKAVICYERALKLDPSMADASTNLNFVNTKILDKPEDDSTFLGNLHEGIIAWMSPNAWAWVAFSLFALLLGCVALYVFTSNIRARKTGFFGGFIVLVLFIYATVVAATAATRPFSHDRAVIIVPTANLSTSPGLNAGKEAKIIPLHEGTAVEIVDSIDLPGEKGSQLWYEVKINNSARAWALASDLEKI